MRRDDRGSSAGEAAAPMRARVRRDGRLLEIDVIDVVSFDAQGRLTSLRAFFDLADSMRI